MSNTHTITVRTSNVAAAARHFGLMVNRAEKLGVEAPTLDSGEPYRRTREVLVEYAGSFHGRYRKVTEEVIDLTLTMPAALVLPGGWTFVASLDCEGDAPIVSNPTGAEIPEAILAAHGECDHCQTKRRRVHTVVVQAEDGRFLQVGKSCLGEFLGDANFAVEALSKFEPSSWILLGAESDDFDRESYRAGDFGLDVDGVTRLAIAAIDAWGWTSKKVAFEHDRLATADRVSEMLWAPKVDEETRAAIDASRTDEVAAEAEAAIEWAKTLTGSEYERNLAELAKRGDVRTRHFGLLVSLASAYRRHVEHETMRRKEAETLVPAPEGRVEIEGEILTAKRRDSEYGITIKLLVLCDGEGGKYKVWVSAPRALTDNQREPGVRVRMTATLKRSKDDASFAFGSRPAKAVAIERV